MRVVRHLLGLFALAAAVALLLAPFPPTLLGPWQGKLLDFGHVPLFAALVVVFRAAFRVALGWVLLAAVVLAALAEVVQPYVGRTRDWSDFAWGALGALAGAAAVRAWRHRRSPRRLAGYAAFAVALPAWPAVETLPYARDTVAGRRAFPVLMDFSTDEQVMRWETKQATVSRAGAIELRPGDDVFSWAAFRPVSGDFRGYGSLCCDLAVGDAVELVLSVRAAAAGGRHTTHAQMGKRFPRGQFVVRYDLSELAAWADRRGEPLNLADVRWVQFFAMNLPLPRTVVVRRVWLER